MDIRLDHKGTLENHSRDALIFRGPMDIPFLMITLLLLTIGVIMVLSASYASAYFDIQRETGGNPTHYFTRQFVFAILGVVAMYLASRMPIAFFRKMALPVLLTALALMVLVLFIGEEVNGARRWIMILGVSVQPSEIAKIAIILFFAKMICHFKNDMGTFKCGVLPFGIVLVGMIVLLGFQPHLSAAVIIIMIGAIMMFIGGTRLIWFGGGIVVVSALLALSIAIFDHSPARITSWLDPFSDPRGAGYQIIQSLLAVGSGGLFGLGLGQSRQKYLYLPEEHNDFIFAIVSEELGFIGATLILILFALLIIRGYWLALHTRDRYSFLVCAGISSLLAIQVILNVAVITNLIPSTGISLPFFSYGGTALLMQMGKVGIILSISRDIPVRKTVKPEKKAIKN